ncbi:hypothetical protein H0H93_004399, partial [Arthromyces matolae]
PTMPNPTSGYLNSTASVENFPPINFKSYLRPGDSGLDDIGDLDAAVICDMGLYVQPPGGRWVLLSPNASWIPEFSTNAHETFIRADGRFYTDDRTLWPQLFCPQFEYICVIPRKPHPFDPNHPLAILWWTPTERDFVLVDDAVLTRYNGAEKFYKGPPNSVTLGRLTDSRVAQLKVFKEKCVAAANKYTLAHGLRSLPGILEQSLRHNWARLTAVPFTYREMIVHVAELQRLCLDIQAFIDFQNVFLPRLYMSDVEVRALPVRHDLIGAVTESELDLHQLVKMRIPVWHLRPSFSLPKTMNILSVEVPLYPFSLKMESGTFDSTPQRILADCGPGTKRQMSMQPLGCAYLGLAIPRSEFALSSSVDIMSRAIQDVSSLQPTVTPGFSTPGQSPAVPVGNIPQPSRNKFEDLSWHSMPSSNPAWSSALRTVGEWARINPSNLTPLGYVYPDPGLIAGSENLRRHYFMMWLARRSYILWKECDDKFQAQGRTRPQGWRDFLGGHLTHEGRKSKEAQRRLELGNKFTARGIVLTPFSSHVTWYEGQYSTSEDLPDSVATQVLWDLFEQNFRAEILALDRHVMKAEWESPDHFMERDRLVQSVLFDCDTGEPGGAYLVTCIPSKDMGLAAADWKIRMRFIKNLHTLMETWPKIMPMPSFTETTEEQWFVEQEEVIARHYCAYFYNIFARAASLLMTDRGHGNLWYGFAAFAFLIVCPLTPMSSRIPRRKVDRRGQELGQSDSISAALKPVTQDSYSLVSVADASAMRKPYGTGAMSYPVTDVYGPEGAMVQLGQRSSFTGVSTDQGGVFSPSRHEHEEERRTHGQKKQNQWIRWTTVVLPTLVKPYLTLLRKTDSLRVPVTSERNASCGCGSTKRKIEVKALYFDHIDSITVCSCQAAVELVSQGLFPCAPLRPSLAVDLGVLDFVRELFLRSAPNNTAWCEALEAFLASRKYLLESPDSLRRRFSNAFHWYEKLNHLKSQHLQEAIMQSRTIVSAELRKSSAEPEPDASNARGNDTSRPSDYLRAKCPLCFGSSTNHRTDQDVDVIVCIDANFTQKRRQNPYGSSRGPADAHRDSVFLSEDQVKLWKERVESVRPSRAPTHSQPSTEADGYEGSIRVPNSVLDDCLSSFTAADEKRTKASAQFFADTGLVAILCRHDIVLWLVNMTTPGERQYYALALLSELFRHLPPDTTVGCLYDIGCQVDRSCVKWSLLDQDILKRLTWAVSVFHAFGHQWPCQLIYHPRKRSGFGLSDGEGCERFWSSIKLLIPSLRVSGHFQRLFSLDRQVEYLNGKSLDDLGVWLKRKWLKCQAKKSEAKEILGRVDLTMEDLEGEWALQVAAQTQPLKRQSKQAGNKAIEEILSLLD